MTGRIELHQEINGDYHVKIVDDLKNKLAVSIYFVSRKAALEGVFALREIAGTAHVIDCTTHETATDQTKNYRLTPVTVTRAGLVPPDRKGRRGGD